MTDLHRPSLLRRLAHALALRWRAVLNGAAPTIVEATCAERTTAIGRRVTLRWKVEGAAVVRLLPERRVLPPAGELRVPVRPGEAAWLITAHSRGGRVTARIPRPPCVDATAALDRRAVRLRPALARVPQGALRRAAASLQSVPLLQLRVWQARFQGLAVRLRPQATVLHVPMPRTSAAVQPTLRLAAPSVLSEGSSA